MQHVLVFAPHQKAVRAKGPHPIIFKEPLKLQIFTFHMQCMRQKIISTQFVAGNICLFIPGPLAKCIEVVSEPTVLGATWQF